MSDTHRQRTLSQGKSKYYSGQLSNLVAVNARQAIRFRTLYTKPAFGPLRRGEYDAWHGWYAYKADLTSGTPRGENPGGLFFRILQKDEGRVYLHEDLPTQQKQVILVQSKPYCANQIGLMGMNGSFVDGPSCTIQGSLPAGDRREGGKARGMCCQCLERDLTHSHPEVDD